MESLWSLHRLSLGFKASTSFLLPHTYPKDESDHADCFIRGKVFVSSVCCIWGIAGSSANSNTVTKSLVFYTVLWISMFSYSLFPSK